MNCTPKRSEMLSYGHVFMFLYGANCSGQDTIIEGFIYAVPRALTSNLVVTLTLKIKILAD